MIKGRVIGEVWATKQVPSLGQYPLKLVKVRALEGATESQRVVVAMDRLGAPTGGDVMVSFGSGARNVLEPGATENRHVLCDCAISQVIDAELPERDGRG